MSATALTVPVDLEDATVLSPFTQADQKYRHAIEAPGRELRSALARARAVPRVNLGGNDLTAAVLLRLRSFFRSQHLTKEALGKRKAAPAADFFVETVCFYLTVALGKLDPTLRVASEKSITRKRGSMRPDISIWRDETLVACVECKTQLGWTRRTWLTDFKKREKGLSKESPGAKLFLLVMTGANWPGFGTDASCDKQFFLLLDRIWPRDIDPERIGEIPPGIERLLSAIVAASLGEP